MNRRGFLRGLIAAPAVVAIDRLMPVKLWRPEPLGVISCRGYFDWDTSGCLSGRFVPLAFDVYNELPEPGGEEDLWRATCQQAIDAIRDAGS